MAEMKDRLRADLTGAMKAKDTFATGVLRMVIAAIANEEVSGKEARELSESEELAVVIREVRKRRESAQAYAAGGRQDLVDKETKEADFLSTYTPAPLTEEELDAIVAEEVCAIEGATIKQMGQIVKAINARVSGRADGATVAAKVRAALSA